MKLITDYLAEMAEYFFKIPPEKIIAKRDMPHSKTSSMDMGNGLAIATPIDYGSYKDLAALFSIAGECETVIFPSSIIRQFIIMARTKRIALTNKWLLPFDHTFIQFTEPIKEKDFFPEVEVSEYQESVGMVNDNVEALILCRDKYTDNAFLSTAMAWYMPTHSVNRVAWWENGQYNTDKWSEATGNKIILRGVATAIAMFLTADNVDLVRKETSEKVNRKRRKHGKKILPTYYETVIQNIGDGAHKRGAGDEGSHHSYMYPVRGHFRHFKNGGRAWIVQHYRGLEHAEDPIPKHAYRIKEQK